MVLKVIETTMVLTVDMKLQNVFQISMRNNKRKQDGAQIKPSLPVSLAISVQSLAL